MSIQAKPVLLLAACQLTFVPRTARAQECSSGGRDGICYSSADCEGNSFAKMCILESASPLIGSCQIPCAANDGSVDRLACSIGETCVPAESDLGDTFFADLFLKF